MGHVSPPQENEIDDRGTLIEQSVKYSIIEQSPHTKHS